MRGKGTHSSSVNDEVATRDPFRRRGEEEKSGVGDVLDAAHALERDRAIVGFGDFLCV
jgi:hypothetical protein